MQFITRLMKHFLCPQLYTRSLTCSLPFSHIYRAMSSCVSLCHVYDSQLCVNVDFLFCGIHVYRTSSDAKIVDGVIADKGSILYAAPHSPPPSSPAFKFKYSLLAPWEQDIYCISISVFLLSLCHSILLTQPILYNTTILVSSPLIMTKSDKLAFLFQMFSASFLLRKMLLGK